MIKLNTEKFLVALAAVAMAVCPVAIAAEGTVRASSFGWNGVDDTKALQQAIDSGAATVVVDRTSAAWVTRPLKGRSNQTLIFERGCELVAKKGEFKQLGASLFACVNVSNLLIRGYGAIWRMHRADYDAAPYKKGEWRHSLAIHGGSNITVEGLTLLESGGDGVYVGKGWKSGTVPCDIVLRDLVCDRHYRQGISIISARRLLIERCVTRNTKGTPPAAGIDFEPNNFAEELTDCIVRDCVSENNQGNSIVLFFGKLDARTKPISVKVERFRSRNNALGLTIATHFMDTYPQGLVQFTDCEFINEMGTGFKLRRKPASAVRIVLENCRFENCQAGALRMDEVSDIEFQGLRFDDPTTDGLEMRNCTVVSPIERDWFSRGATALVGDKVHAVSGDVTVKTPAGTRKVVLNRKWCDEHFKAPALSRWPQKMAFNASRARVVDKCPGVSVKLPRLKVRGRALYKFYVPAAGTAVFTGTTVKLGRNTLSKAKMFVRDSTGREILKLDRPGADSTQFKVKVPAAGFYELDVPVLGHAFRLEESNVPVALDMTDSVNFLSSAGELRFFAGDGEKFVLTAAGGGGQERVNVQVRNPSGKVVWDKERIGAWEAYGDGGKGYWTVKLSPAPKSIFDDHRLAIRGVQPVAFLSEEKYW